MTCLFNVGRMKKTLECRNMYRKLKYVVIYLKLLTNFVILRSFGNLIYDITFKYNGIVDVKQLRKWEKLQIKVKKAELDLTFKKKCQAYNVYPKFVTLIFLIQTELMMKPYENVFSKVRSTEEEKCI